MLKRFLSITLLAFYVSTGWVQAQETKAQMRTHLTGLGVESRLADYLVSKGAISYGSGVAETVAAAGSVQGDGALTAGKYIHLVTGFDETKVATLPACAAANVGETHFILNNTTDKFAKIFPASGGTINSLSANAAYTQGVTGQGGKVLMCFCQAANQWYCA